VKTAKISSFSRLTDSDTFIELASGELERRGFFEAKEVCAVQDGAEWIQTLIEAHRADAVRILDFYHAASYRERDCDAARPCGQASGGQLVGGATA
jgi:hypothetical protein